jgi:hypothetical protein
MNWWGGCSEASGLFLRRISNTPTAAAGSQITRLRIRNFNMTSFLATTGALEKFARHAIPLLIARLGLPDNSLVMHNVSFGEPTPRNLPPTAFSPPLAPPNNWLNRTTFVDLITLGGVSVPSCSALQAAGPTALAGFDISWDACTVVDLAPETATCVASFMLCRWQ